MKMETMRSRQKKEPLHGGSSGKDAQERKYCKKADKSAGLRCAGVSLSMGYISTCLLNRWSSASSNRPEARSCAEAVKNITKAHAALCRPADLRKTTDHSADP